MLQSNDNNNNNSADAIPPHVYDAVPSFQVLNDIVIEDILHSLSKHNNYINHSTRLQDGDKIVLLSPGFWSDVVKEYIKRVHSCVDYATNAHRLKSMQRKLLCHEEELAQQFATNSTSHFVGEEDNERCYFYIGLLGILCTTVFEIIKSDLCFNRSSSLIQLQQSVITSMTLHPQILHKKFIELQNGKDITESVYYIAGWLIQSCNKASQQQRDDLQKCMVDLYKNSTLEKGASELSLLPTKKVNEIIEFDGLHYVSSSFYNLVLRLEYVFIINLHPTKLAILGSTIIQKLYNKLKESTSFRAALMEILSNDYKNEIIIDLTTFIVTCYCRMRGKDFCRQMMTVNFNNLGKALRSKLAVLSDRELYTKKGKKDTKTNLNILFDETTDKISDNTDGEEEDGLLQ